MSNLTSCRTAKLRFKVVAAAVGRLCYTELSHAIRNTTFRSRSHAAVNRVYAAAAGN
jgi:hypothetical protein